VFPSPLIPLKRADGDLVPTASRARGRMSPECPPRPTIGTSKGGQISPLLTAAARTCPLLPARDTDRERIEMEKPTPNKRRMLRRLRADFRRDLGGGDMSRAERVLVEQAALVALRTREMQDQIIAGAQIDDEDFVRLVRATSSIMKTFRDHRVAKPKAKPVEQRRVFDENDF
jgi:hypothetical protein